MLSSNLSGAFAALFDAAGTPDFGAGLDRLALCVAQFDMSCVFAFSETAPPVVIHDGYSDSVDRRALQSYLRGAYLLDPFYAASVTARTVGLWRMAELAPDAYFDGDFVRSQEVHPCISDQVGSLIEEIGYIVPLSEGFTATYSLMRNRGGSSFASEEMTQLESLVPVIAASLRLHWRLAFSTSRREMAVMASDAVFEQAFDGLTPAQTSVAKMILRGHSGVSIAANLGIAEGTVKQHRHNIYKRLGISSQSELFQRFIHYLQDPTLLREVPDQ